MRLMPWSWNHIIGVTPSTSAAQSELAFPATRLADSDIHRPWLGMGPITIGSYKWIDFDEGIGEINAQVTPATYVNVGAFLVHLAAVLTAAGADTYWARWRQDSAARFRYEIGSDGTFDLLNATGANANASACVKHMGFMAEDTGVAASHTGTFAVHGTPRPAHATASGEYTVWDLTTPQTVQAAVILRPVASPGLNAMLRLGTAAATANYSAVWTDYDSDVMALFLSAPQLYRYARLQLIDAHRTDSSQTGAGGLYLGPYYESQGFTWSTYAHGHEQRTATELGATGVTFLSELKPGESFSLGFTQQPGIRSADIDAMRTLLEALGTSNRVIVALDPDNEPNRETALCELVSLPDYSHYWATGRAGDWGPVSIGLRAVR